VKTPPLAGRGAECELSGRRTCYEAKTLELLKQRIECNDVGRVSGEAGGKSMEMAACTKPPRAAKPALDDVEMGATGCAEDDERSTSKQKEIIEDEGEGVRRWWVKS
jgi:hypothetical protein